MADSRSASARPLSPHLQVYRWKVTMAMSILHRVTGVGLYLGTVLLVWWLLAAATGPAAFETAQWFFGSILGRLILFGYTWALFQHMLGGIRHLIWDTGAGLGPGVRDQIAWATAIAAPVLTVLVWIVAYAAR
jgi:succinate dehydrogenase / fumarate reductase cytochrome b subunit